MVPPQPVSQSDPLRDADPTGSERKALPEAEEPVGRYAQEQLAQIRAARQGFEDEKKAAEQALEQRRQELERQSQLLVGRLQELHEREQRLAEELEDALPERLNEYPRRARLRNNAGEDSQIIEEEVLRRQLHEQQMSLELLSAERDAAWAQLQQYRDQAHEVEALRAERDALRAQVAGETAPPEPPPDVQDLQRQVELLKQQYEQIRKERDEAWSYLQELPERVQQLEKVKGERDAALEQLRSLTESVEKQDADDDSWVDLDSPQAGKLLGLQTQLHVQQDLCKQLEEERDVAYAELRRLQESPTRLEEEVVQLRSERDAAIEQLRQLSAEPESWAQEEAEFAALRLQLKQEQRQLAEDVKELHHREAENQRKAETAQQEVGREQQRLDLFNQELEELARQLHHDREEMETKERDMRLRDAQIHLREAEIREMIEIAELDAARERSELNQERLKLARLREAVKLERESLRADLEKHGKNPPSLGSDF